MAWLRNLPDHIGHIGARMARTVSQRAYEFRAEARALFQAPEFSFFHEFAPPPTGGGHQFLRALWRELERRGSRLENNAVSRTTRSCLFNSFNFDFTALRRIRRKRPRCLFVHRVDGPIGLYRGFDDGTDQRILEVNRALADVTVFQSKFSLEAHQRLGMDFRQSVIIPNAPDPEVFYPMGRTVWSTNRKIRLISVSWSDNPNKGAADYAWLDRNLNFKHFEYTFVGRVGENLQNVRHLQPMDSMRLAEQLRQHDIFITASRHDPCSNSLLEALNCGLPALYLQSGGHAELVGGGGLGYEKVDEVPGLLDVLAEQYSRFQSAIPRHDIATVTDGYLALLQQDRGDSP